MDIESALAQYVTPANIEELFELASVVDRHVVLVEEIARSRDFVDVALAKRLGAVLNELILGADQYTGRERALLGGAVRYFAEHDDLNGDLVRPTGFEDDAEILNAVCVFLGRGDLTVSFE